ncbi:glutamate-cysteine ligase [Trinickia symbiotica]|uniref:Glutamate--cysteine ligase n=1 Tax=Trinickia symbiotica TaxID=863227 RepID=A0A2N7X776_9BURK|nr:glutamate--cysteine ligase [Trinickia symbiotica]PMS37619.1 glutamate--cysteine ligase [Trinickia symbiotica]PPK43962.1 glutamate-cysteine ligase [Trinickia symbiotica]
MSDHSPSPFGTFAQRLSILTSPAAGDVLARGLRGIEKESLRVTLDGSLAMTPHPRVFGSALTHPSLTTDYSEALMELITPAERDPRETLARLDELHRLVYSALDGEMLWTCSMPGKLPEDDQIPIAEYGASNIGRLKHVYRHGLALRYGRTMQCIAGIHYNYSLNDETWRLLHAAEPSPATAVDYQSARYLALIRNFRRTNWLLMYLFGASPALYKPFLRGRPHTLEAFDADTLYRPYATSLRMSDLGYSNTTGQAALRPDYETLSGYLDALARAVSEPYAPYEAIGTHRDGEWVQINTNVLQIENEFYSTIRPKRVAGSGERPLHALAARGVQYVEVRCLDIDPFEPSGIALETARFLDAYLLLCALDDSPPLPAAAYAEANANFGRVTLEGRKPGLLLTRDGGDISLEDWAAELVDGIEQAARALDALAGGDAHVRAVAAQRAKLADPETTPSARVLRAMRERGQGFLAFGLAQSEAHAAHFRARPLDIASAQEAAATAARSLEEQAELERRDAGSSFDAFVADFRGYTLERFSV